MEQLYIEYENSIAIQQNAIRNTTEKLNKAKRGYNYTEIKRLNTLLRVLYEEKWELEEKARGIRRYMEKD